MATDPSRITKIFGTAITLTALVLARPAAAKTLTIDPTKSEIGFSVINMGVNKVNGRFHDFSGKIDVDPDAVEKSSVQVTIKATSIDTGIEKRDHHLRSADFFDVEHTPDLTFQSKVIKKVGDKYQMIGDLTIKGITHPVPVVFIFKMNGGTAGNIKPPDLEAEGTATIDRRDFGLTYGNAFTISHEVKIHLKIVTQ